MCRNAAWRSEEWRIDNQGDRQVCLLECPLSTHFGHGLPARAGLLNVNSTSASPWAIGVAGREFLSDDRRVSATYYGLFALIGVATYLIHEAAHWLVGAALGYQVSFGINSVIPGSAMKPLGHMLMSAAGPAVTVLIALMAFALVMRRKSLTAYAVLYFALFMRVVAAGVSLFNLNDEARVSDMLGWGPWTLPGVVILVLLIPTIIASRHLRLTWKVNVLAYVVSSLVTTAVVGLDMVHRGTI